MNELATTTEKLTPIEVLLQVDGDGNVSAKRVYEFLELDARNYSRWCKENITDNIYADENADYKVFVIKEENPKGGRPSTDYKLTASFAKKLCMQQKNERGEQAREYFVRVENTLKKAVQPSIDFNKLSPDLQMFKRIWDSVAQSQLEQQELHRKVEKVEKVITAVSDTILSRDDDWRESMSKMFNKTVAESGIDYKTLRQMTYDILEERAKCDLSARLRNLKARLTQSGATKTKINSATRLDVIEGDTRLKEIYTAIVKEFSIKYAAVAAI